MIDKGKKIAAAMMEADAGDLVDDAPAHGGEHVVGDLGPVRGHAVVGLDDADGHDVVDGIGDRVVAIGRADLERITCVIAICSERDKGDAIRGALRTGMVNVLVANLSLARTVLELSGRS